jgi:hypothetical protein
MTEYKFEELFESGEFDDEYSDYIMENCHGDRVICNGDTLIEAIEDGYLYESFKEFIMEKVNG